MRGEDSQAAALFTNQALKQVSYQPAMSLALRGDSQSVLVPGIAKARNMA